ncbi:alpha/beta fold hydrolase [Mucilaginibacter sp. KACC 22063]|uniref:alpha/beta fold hydrolase n=1 Tax=Mucilaginibacter sp. KACC 22063 TaxID=3025666 RepID=UPI002365A17A|nr:alpha/beta fold hydrolase [Mucilaginibacter sp. KACC 22063]WDF57176.1 alpha/beta fold hydrolase [Mucilaginibacter sp. KACC 22063]
MKRIKYFILCYIFSASSYAQAQMLYSKAIGNPKNEALIFIHGGPGSNSATFEATTAKKLANKGFYVVFYDRRGEGRSVDTHALYTFQQTFNDLNAVYRKYHLKKAHLIAFSFGGVVSTLYAQKYPEKVKSLLLTSALLSLPETYQTIINRCDAIYRTKSDSAGLRQLNELRSLDRGSYAFRTGCFKQASLNGFFHTPHPNPLAQELYAAVKTDTLLTRLPVDTSSRASKALWRHEHYSMLNMMPILKTLPAKGIRLFGIYGKDDGLYTPKQIAALRTLTGKDHLLYLDSAAHYLYVDRQQAFINAISQWLLPIQAQVDLMEPFRDYKLKGSTTIYDYKNKKWLFSDQADAGVAMLPASTFKVVNILIALEAGTIKDENEIVKWPGSTDTVKYGYRPEIYHDISVKEAFEVSAGWAFVELAKKINRNIYQHYLDACGYGNHDLTEKGDDFWNFGTFGISPRNQVEFLIKVYEGKLPFSKRSIDILKKVMITEKTLNYTIRSKTGWTKTGNRDLGWWVGYVECKDNVFFFATRLIKPRAGVNSNFGNARKEITKNILRQLRAL